jgi:hypothetical protein
MTSLIASIRAAVRPGAVNPCLDDVDGDNEATAGAADTEPPILKPTPGGDMSENQTVAGAEQSDAATNAALAAAASGGADGFKQAMDRMNAILGHDSIKGDAKRMSAAVELANASPDMAADAVIKFVSANVSATAAEADKGQDKPAPSPAAYEQQRMAAAGLAMPGGKPAAATGPKINRDAIFAARRTTPKGA